MLETNIPVNADLFKDPDESKKESGKMMKVDDKIIKHYRVLIAKRRETKLCYSECGHARARSYLLTHVLSLLSP